MVSQMDAATSKVSKHAQAATEFRDEIEKHMRKAHIIFERAREERRELRLELCLLGMYDETGPEMDMLKSEMKRLMRIALQR